jgi:hypothetical protein
MDYCSIDPAQFVWTIVALLAALLSQTGSNCIVSCYELPGAAPFGDRLADSRGTPR